MRRGRLCIGIVLGIISLYYMIIINESVYYYAGISIGLIALFLLVTSGEQKQQPIVIQQAPPSVITTSEVKYLVVCPFCGSKNEQGVTLCSNCKAKI